MYGAVCNQVTFTGKVKGEEDCLNLNIFLPRDREGLLPVMVWIYGGAFIEGSGQVGTPDPLLERGVMVITINYRYDVKNKFLLYVTIHLRLSALGFMTFGNNLVSGNMGLRDQVLALQWVQDNIENYGGNPEQVS